MSVTAPATPSAPTPAFVPPRSVRGLDQLATFRAVLARDLFVTGRELGAFLAQVFIQPLFMLLIFGKVLGELGYASNDFANVLLPGVIALNAFLIGLENTALPLVMDFSFTREIEDRLLSPLSIPLVAFEKIIFGAIRGTIAGLVLIPIGMLMLGVTWPVLTALKVMVVLAAGALVGAALGLTFGTLVPPHRIQIMFTVIMTPLMFTGATQFPLRALDSLPWFQVICSVNPLTYVSEATRSLVAPPGVESVPLWLDLTILAGVFVVATAIGTRGFMRRSMD
ncbi:ABC-2 type transporter [Micromonospora sp. MW-13]|uniref:ABC transporter permease n=1 Tax=unclassified Micromonospora TaxID=2617518 RepID=UPI000E4340B5|nr:MULTISPECIES: ABC transporter permease [unclassified Micromonospora]MCX4473477.1 ABC transporter permease [Micromonospora sp. NBC_01655]RGC67518.1 ABC-2 type transporter [Micromonospora sp. MW-13]